MLCFSCKGQAWKKASVSAALKLSNESYISNFFLRSEKYSQIRLIFFFFFQFVVVLLLLFLKWHQSLKPEIETVSAADSSPCKPKQQLVKDKGLLGLLCLGEMC